MIQNKKNLILGIGEENCLGNKIANILVESLSILHSEKNSDYHTGNHKGLDLISKFYGYETVIIIDTVNHSLISPGKIHLIHPFNCLRKKTEHHKTNNISVFSALDTLKLIEKDLPEKIFFLLIGITDNNSINGIINKEFAELIEDTKSIIKILINLPNLLAIRNNHLIELK